MPWRGGVPCAVAGWMADLTALQAAARALLPPGCGVGVADPGTPRPGFPGEEIAAVAARLAEFRAGRVAARLAMAELGLPPVPVPMQRDRAPLWPMGLCGSITHSGTLCLAAVARRPLRGLGLDLEPATPLEDDLRDIVLRPEERDAAPDLAKLIFCAKEAAYKAQYPISRRLFDFQALAVQIEGGQFTATFTEDIPPFPRGTQVLGRHAQVDGHFLCAVTL